MNEGRDRQKAISPMSDEAAAMPHIPRILQTETQDRPGDLREPVPENRPCMLFFPENRLPGRGFPEHLTISDRLFDWLNDSEGMGTVDLNADERNSLPTVRTEDGNVFEIVCRQAAGKEDGWMSAN